MQNRVQANEYRNTLVCIDSYVDGVLDGRLYHPQLHSGEQFHSAIHFLRKMERLLDATKFPQAFSTPRAFGASAAGRAAQQSEQDPGRAKSPPSPSGSSSGRTPAGRALWPGWRAAANSDSAAC